MITVQGASHPLPPGHDDGESRLKGKFSSGWTARAGGQANRVIGGLADNLPGRGRGRTNGLQAGSASRAFTVCSPACYGERKVHPLPARHGRQVCKLECENLCQADQCSARPSSRRLPSTRNSGPGRLFSSTFVPVPLSVHGFQEWALEPSHPARLTSANTSSNLLIISPKSSHPAVGPQPKHG